MGRECEHCYEESSSVEYIMNPYMLERYGIVENEYICDICYEKQIEKLYDSKRTKEEARSSK